jgi:hypothetical protein
MAASLFPADREAHRRVKLTDDCPVDSGSGDKSPDRVSNAPEI